MILFQKNDARCRLSLGTRLMMGIQTSVKALICLSMGGLTLHINLLLPVCEYGAIC